MDIVHYILVSLYLLAPAGFANTIPVTLKGINFLNYPVDFNKKFRGKPFFGKNKTWRGFTAGILTAILTAFIQKMLLPVPFFSSITILNYDKFILIGFVLGFGALFGDLVESFVKRRLNMREGRPLIFLDQADWITGSLLFLSFIAKYHIIIVPLSLFIFYFLHVLFKHIGYYIGVNDTKW